MILVRIVTTCDRVVWSDAREAYLHSVSVRLEILKRSKKMSNALLVTASVVTVVAVVVISAILTGRGVRVTTGNTSFEIF